METLEHGVKYVHVNVSSFVYIIFDAGGRGGGSNPQDQHARIELGDLILYV